MDFGDFLRGVNLVVRVCVLGGTWHDFEVCPNPCLLVCHGCESLRQDVILDLENLHDGRDLFALVVVSLLANLGDY